MTEQSSTNPYFVAELRNSATGELNADAICKVFGFDQIDFEKFSKEHNNLYPTNFDDMVLAQGYDVLTRQAMAVARIVDPERKKPEEQLTAEMQDYMKQSPDGISRVNLVRRGGAALILESIYGGVRKDCFAANRDDDNEIADWLGFDRGELLAVARANGLALFEAIASVLVEMGVDLARIKEYYSLAEGAANHGMFAPYKMSYMLGHGGLQELYTVSGALSSDGKREWVESNFGDLEMVYRRPANK